MQHRSLVTSSGVCLAYQVTDSPESPPMLLLHALGERGSHWTPVIEQFAERFQVLTVDLRGHGDSDWPGEYSFQLMYRDILDVIDQLGLRRITLAGHSMGAIVAYLLAMQNPERVTRLIIEDAPPPFRRDRTVPERPIGPVPFDWPVVPAIVAQVNAGDPATWKGLSAINAPTLIIGGGPDSHIPQDKLAEAATHIPDCTLVTIPAGHNVHTNRPGEFTETVLNWSSGRVRPVRWSMDH
jgi:pimeloyl-ACP methyl ester carboxylesterase